MTLTDAELAVYLGISKAKERDKIIARITPAQRAVYEEMALTELGIKLFLDGKGPRPKGVLLCGRNRRANR